MSHDGAGLIFPRVLKMPTSLSHSPTKTTGLRWHSASMKHLGKTNLGRIYTGFVGQSLCLWTACCRLACVHTAESWECLLGTDQPMLCSAWSWPPLGNASLQIYVFIYMCFLIDYEIDPRMGAVCSHLLPLCSGKWLEGHWGFGDFRQALQCWTRWEPRLCSAYLEHTVRLSMPSFPLKWKKWLPNGQLTSVEH